MNITPGIAALLGALAIFLFIYSVWAPKKHIATARKNDNGILSSINSGDPEVSEEPSSFEKYIKPALRNFLPQSPLSSSLSQDKRTKIEQLLIKSGNPWKINAEEFRGLQLLFAFVGFFIGLVLTVLQVIPVIPPIAILLLAPLGGFVWPQSFHNTRREARSSEIQKQLPEALDLLVVTLISGQNFEPALRSVTEKLPQGLLRTELSKVSLELQSGRSLENALTAFAHRSSNENAEGFAKAVVQAQSLGADVSDTLSGQASAARRNYEALLERKTARLNTTMFIPLIATMLPALLLTFVAPALIPLSGQL